MYTPPKRLYDRYGNVTLSLQAPATGAGIATLNPILATILVTIPGDIDLIAPLDTIDAGEAGIRVSGNINIAALQIVSAANIQVQGSSSGIPTVQAPNVSAALATSNATAATQQTAVPNQGAGNERPSVIIVEVLGYGGGGGDAPTNSDDDRRRNKPDERAYNNNSVVQFVDAGTMDDDQRRRLVERGGL